MLSFNIESLAFTQLDDYFRRFPEVSAKAMRMAINDVAKGRGMKSISRSMMDQVSFSSSYLRNGRLAVTKRATNSNLEAVITARKRATSLARFTTGSKNFGGKNGVTVRVKKGKTTFLKKAWLVRLNKGASKDEDNFNIGIAIRVGPAERVLNKRTEHSSWLVRGKVALLYAPSVNQVFMKAADDKGDDVAKMVATEYLRQMSRLL